MKTFPFILEQWAQRIGSPANSDDNPYVCIAGLCQDMDPEKLKYCMSATFDDKVSDMWFDVSRAKAVVKFNGSIGNQLVFDVYFELWCSQYNS